MAISPKKNEAVPKQQINFDGVCVVTIGDDNIDLRLQPDIDHWIEKENNKPKKGTSPKKVRDVSKMSAIDKMITVIQASGTKEDIQVMWGEIFKVVDNKVPSKKGTCATDIAEWALKIQTTMDD